MVRNEPLDPKPWRRLPVNPHGHRNTYDLDEETFEFIAAVNRFKERTGRVFPSWSEILVIIKELGYRK